MSQLELHTLLERQLRRFLPDIEPSGGLKAFITAIDAAYRQSDEGRLMMERAFELSSDELMRANTEIREATAELEQRVDQRTAQLSRANAELQHLATTTLSQASTIAVASKLSWTRSSPAPGAMRRRALCCSSTWTSSKT